MPTNQAPPISLADRIGESATTGTPIAGELKTDDRIIARVTDGIYREPWSAFRELISNSYDADATQVSVDCDYPFFKEIRISDDGNGMDQEIFEHLLEHIGGSSKRTAKGSELGTASQTDAKLSPAGRKLIGKIGIGLFAVAQLTQEFQIITKKRGETKRISASIQLNTYREDDGSTEDYSSGRYNVIAEETSEVDTHGTTIILTSIRPAIRQKLQSEELWSAFEQYKNDDDAGLFDAISIPKYHIGRIDQNSELSVEPNLPWSHDSTPVQRFNSLVDAAVVVGPSARDQANLSHFDSYLKMIWRLSLACPVPYIDGHPFDLKGKSGLKFYELSNSQKGSAAAVEIEGDETVRQSLDLLAGEIDPIGEFKVLFDAVELRRPIILPSELKAASPISNPLMFVGKVQTDFGRAATSRSGGSLKFEAYLYWNSKIIPKESVGVLIRVNGASGTLFDPEFLGYQVSEQTRKKQITCEIFVHEGLDGALNIDRESYNTSHPHYLYIQKWLHSAFRQFATQHKRLGAQARKIRTEEKTVETATKLQSVSTSVWSKMRGPTPPPDIHFEDDGAGVQIPTSVGGKPLVWNSDVGTKESVAKTSIIEAVTLVLEAHGVLSELDEKGRAELIIDLMDVFENT